MFHHARSMSRPVSAMLAALSILGASGLCRGQTFVPVGTTAEHNNNAYAGRITAVAPITRSIIVIGTDGGGLWKTEDGGRNWLPKSDWMQSLRITAIAASSNGNKVYAMTYDPVRLLRSVNGGDSFEEIWIEDLHYAKQEVFRLVVHPGDADTVYAVTTRGLLRTTDSGLNWSLVTNNGNQVFEDIAILPGNNCTMILATQNNQLFYTITAFDQEFTQVTLPPADGGPPASPGAKLLFAQKRPHRGGAILFGFSGAGDALYAGADTGLCEIVVDYVKRHPDPMAMGRTATFGDSGHYFITAATTILGFSRLERQKGSWNGIGAYNDVGPFEAVPGPYAAGINAVISGRTIEDPTAADSREALYVATDRGLWRWIDNSPGEKWENLNGDLVNLFTDHMHVSRDSRAGRIVDAAENGVIVYRSGWKVASNEDAVDVFMRNDDANRGGALVKGALLTSDRLIRVNGAVASNFPAAPPCPRPARGRFALDPSDPSNVCVADGVVHCSDGAGYDPWCFQSPDIGAVEASIHDGQVIWARTDTHQVMRTDTGIGGTWDDVTPNLQLGREIIAIAASEFDPLRALILAGTSTTDIQVYETTDGGGMWQASGDPPILGRTTTPDPPECTTVPCPQVSPVPPRILSLGVIFSDPNLGNTELWYVGTSVGLRVSGDGGSSWLTPPEVPRTPVNEIDTTSGSVALATGGRGVWVDYQLGFPYFDPRDVACSIWCWLRIPLPQPDPWASWLVALSDEVLSEIIEPRTGRVFRRGDQPFGATDFLITPGAAVMGHADEPWAVQIDGPPDRARPIQLTSGWNAVGIPSVLTTSLDVVADAAAQGITIESMVEGVTPPAGRSNHIHDFDLSPTAGYWIFVCGEGGLWTPGAGILQGP